MQTNTQLLSQISQERTLTFVNASGQTVINYIPMPGEIIHIYPGKLPIETSVEILPDNEPQANDNEDENEVVDSEDEKVSNHIYQQALLERYAYNNQFTTGIYLCLDIDEDRICIIHLPCRGEAPNTLTHIISLKEYIVRLCKPKFIFVATGYTETETNDLFQKFSTLNQ